MYPTLPAVSSAAEMSHGYPAPVSSAPVSSLAANFSDSRRYDVGVLRRANDKSTSTSTAEDVEMEFTNSDAGKQNQEISNSLIDPSLGTSKQQQLQQQDAAPKPVEQQQPVTSNTQEIEAELTRTFELQKALETCNTMRAAIAQQMQEFQNQAVAQASVIDQQQDGDGDHAMSGDIQQQPPQQQQQQDAQPQQPQQQQQKVEEPTDEQALYPILRAVEAC